MSVVPPVEKPVCEACNDTHTVWHPGLERQVPCTRCPIPCLECGGGRGYCKTARCACVCHVPLPKKPKKTTPREQRLLAELEWVVEQLEAIAKTNGDDVKEKLQLVTHRLRNVLAGFPR